MTMSTSTVDELMKILDTVMDPEIHRPITDLDMVRNLAIDEDGKVSLQIALTIPGCPLQNQIRQEATDKLSAVEGVTEVKIEMTTMTREEVEALRDKLMGARPVIPFTQDDSMTRVYAVTSGKGGVGKSSITANLAAAMAAQGLKVAVLDCDIYGFSIPRMMGLEGAAPTPVGDMMMPPEAHGVKVISMGMFVPDGQPVVWRGPMLHRALEQFLAETFWGDLDVLLLDLPPGTGDVAISVAQLLPNSEIIVVTTPQLTAAEVAERAGSIASSTNQKVVGVIENMSYMPGADGSRIEVFGSGGGEQVAQRLAEILGYSIPLLAQIPLETAYSAAADSGVPIAISEAGQSGQSVAGSALREVGAKLGKRAHSLKGHRLKVNIK